MKCPNCNHTIDEPTIKEIIDTINRCIKKIDTRIQELERLKKEKQDLF